MGERTIVNYLSSSLFFLELFFGFVYQLFDFLAGFPGAFVQFIDQRRSFFGLDAQAFEQVFGAGEDGLDTIGDDQRGLLNGLKRPRVSR